MAEPAVPKFRVPLKFVDGRALVVEQDEQREVEQCVEAVLRTERGLRVERPDFGIPDFVHRLNGPDVAVVIEAVDDAEPRAQYTAIADGSELSELVGRIVVNMTGDESNE